MTLRFLKPGGWLECHEFEMTMVNADDGSNTPPNNLCVEWSGFMRDGCMAGGVNPQCVSHFGEYLRNAGFIDIHKTLYRWPWCPWSDDPKEKEIGRMNAINQDASSMSLGLLTKNLGWSRERVEVYLTGVKKALLDTNLHTYVPVFIWWARKPEILEPNK
ncbi:MAG: hypothetical protein M1834_006898 [Cirrosporium novae-zelandiae]|nr:MAG: hypothetical protein M1834_006898 [Cirrosporium novae-zelandiae]